MLYADSREYEEGAMICVCPSNACGLIRIWSFINYQTVDVELHLFPINFLFIHSFWWNNDMEGGYENIVYTYYTFYLFLYFWCHFILLNFLQFV